MTYCVAVEWARLPKVLAVCGRGEGRYIGAVCSGVRAMRRQVVMVSLVCALGLGLWVASRPVAPPVDRLGAEWRGYQPARIVALGTSLTAGNGWPDRLSASLSACFERSVEVVRVAEPGRGSGWALTQIDRVVGLAPDMVLIELAINDADVRDGVSLRDSLGQHEALVEALDTRLPKARIALMTMSPAYGLRGVFRFRLAAYYEANRAVAEAVNIGLIDFYPRWQAAEDIEAPDDGLHPSDAATAQVMDPVFQDIFCEDGASSP